MGLTANNLYSLNDEPVLKNAFDDTFIARLCEIIKESRPPKNIAITGYWGSGKTSTLKQLYFHLTGKIPPGCTQDDTLKAKHQDETLLPVWFEAWRYQHEDQPIVALLHEIRTEMGIYSKLLEKSEKIATVSLLGALNIFDEVIKLASGGTIKPETGKIQVIGEKWEQERYLNKLPREQINKCLEEAIKEVLRKRDAREQKLIIFIDDLDRCLPQASLRLLEGIKIYLNLQNCIVVFGMDHRQLEQSLLQALPGVNINNEADKRRAAYYAREYLEKICQDIHYIPVPSRQEKADYFMKLLQQTDCGADQQINVHEKYLAPLFEKFDCLPANPRKIKILVNRAALTLRVLTPPEDTEKAERWYRIMLIVIIIYAFHRPVHEQLETNPAYINEVMKYNQVDSEARENEERFRPMQGIFPTMDGEQNLPVNPSDANVWRLHELINSLETVTRDEITPFLRLQ